jgi:hypothetical protein
MEDEKGTDLFVFLNMNIFWKESPIIRDVMEYLKRTDCIVQ